MENKTFEVDACVMTVIPIELHSVLRGLDVRPTTAAQTLESGSAFWHSSVWSVRNKRKIKLAVGCIARAGNPDAAAATVEFINAFKPKFILLCGIAAGMRDKVQIGNVVLSTHIVSYEPGVLQLGLSGQSVSHRPDVVPIHQSVSQDVATYLASRLDATRTFQKIHGDFLEPPQETIQRISRKRRKSHRRTDKRHSQW